MPAGRSATASSSATRTRGWACSATIAAARCWSATYWRPTAWARPTARRSPSPTSYRTRFALRQVADDPNCFTFQELFPGGFTPQTGGTATEAALVGRRARLYGRRLQLGPERLARDAPTPTSSSTTPSTRRSGSMSPNAFDVGRNQPTGRQPELRRVSVRSPRGSISRPARNGATSSSACERATARDGRSARTRRNASWPGPTGSSPTARRRRAPGAATTSRPTATWRWPTRTRGGRWGRRSASRTSRTSERLPTARCRAASASSGAA